MSKHECGPKSHCKTKRCLCKEEGEYCDENFCFKCQCNGKICSNKDPYLTNDSDEEQKLPKILSNENSYLTNDSGEEDEKPSKVSSVKSNLDRSNIKKSSSNLKTNICSDFSDNNIKEKIKPNHKDILDLASDITKIIRVPVSSKRIEVFEFRNNKDIYTDANAKDVDSPEVDHIVEDQILGHATAKALKSSQAYTPYIDSIKDALNLKTLENYNVTFKKINTSKGAIIKSYLRDDINRGYPLRSLIKPETHFGKNVESIFQAMNDTYPVIAEYIIENGRRSDGHITGSKTFQDISEELVKSFEEMDLDLDSGRKLRTRKK